MRNTREPHLVQKDEKDDIVSKASDAIQHRHLNDKREYVIDERVECLLNANQEVQELRTHPQLATRDEKSIIPCTSSFSKVNGRQISFCS